MSTLANISISAGSIGIIASLVLLAVKQVYAIYLRHLPRHIWDGRIMATLAWGWGAYALYTMPLDFILPYRHYIPFLTLVLIPLSWYWMEDLLFCRAAGGLLVLFPAPLLKLTDQCPSQARLFIVVLTYLALTAGMIFILYPFYLRRFFTIIAMKPVIRRIFGLMLFIISVILILSGYLYL